jgi:hypothetical protein
MMQIQRGKAPDVDGWRWEVTGYFETAPALGSLSMLGSLAETIFGGRATKAPTAA